MAHENKLILRQILQLQNTRLLKEEWFMENELQFILCKKKNDKK